MVETVRQDMVMEASRQMPYRVELDDGAVLALCGSSSVAYAAYYAGLREYLGRRLSLRRGEQLLMTSEPRPAGF